jgi:CDP-paratose 2-epimerase
MRILITGGAGFVGSSLAFFFRERDPAAEIVAFDNLRRRGSELNLDRFRKAGIEFLHGDVRSAADLRDLDGNFDLLIDAAAEPSVQAGLGGSADYVIATNLAGTLNCLEFVRKRVASFVFLSTSRVYSIQPLRRIVLEEAPSRFRIAAEQVMPGVSERGISESFPTQGPRSFYGASKLAAELMIQEYVDAYGIHAIIDRCGVIAGPGQYGKVDQGVVTWWVLSHYFGLPLRYTGFGGLGKQVRDVLHPRDLFELITAQLGAVDRCSGEVFNVGGGGAGSVSLLELTEICREVVGAQVDVAPEVATNGVDVPLYISDNRRVSEAFSWAPRRSVREVVQQIAAWLRANEAELRPLFGAAR